MSKPEVTPPVFRLSRLLDNDIDAGEITEMEKECEVVMTEIEKTAKELKGKPANSSRYLVAREIKYLIGQLRKLMNGTYAFTLSGEEVD